LYTSPTLAQDIIIPYRMQYPSALQFNDPRCHPAARSLREKMDEHKFSRVKVLALVAHSTRWVTLAASVIAIVLSMVTLYSNYWDTGSLQVYYPKEFSVDVKNNSYLCPYFPVTLFDTAPASNAKVVNEIVLRSRIIPGEDQYVDHDWSYFERYMSTLDYNKTYPDNKTDLTLPDQLVYDGRVLPFSILGKQSLTRLIYFKCAIHLAPTSAPSRLEVVVQIGTAEGELITAPPHSYDIPQSFFAQYNNSSETGSLTESANQKK
jgi:hypothetical protein